MKKIRNIVILAVTVLAFFILYPKEVEAKNYSIEDMDIQATILKNGSVRVKQTIEYYFDGSYNGVYINIPYQTNTEDINVLENRKINDNLYNATSVTVEEVKELKKNLVYQKSDYAYNGSKGIYTIEDQSNITEIKVYSPSENETKKFQITYLLNNLCVKHNDIGELYYNFIGGEWEKSIKKLNMDIYLPNNESEILIWGHGPYQGESKIISKQRVNFKVNGVKPGEYVATRVVFDNANIINSTKYSRIEAKNIILEEENVIYQNEEQKNKFTLFVAIIAIMLFIYWIILLFMFEKDKKYKVTHINEDELFNKYNPLVAGCIQGSRDILARDILAVILNLIEKKNIKLEIRNQVSQDEYSYLISKNKEKEDSMDEIETYIYNWIFERNDIAYLAHRLKDMPKEKEANKKFRKINELMEKELASKNIARKKMPIAIRVINSILFVICIFIIYWHISFNGLNIYNNASVLTNGMMILAYMIGFLPIIIGLSFIPINLIIIMRHKVNKVVQRMTGQRVVTTTISIIILFLIIILITAFITRNKYLIVDEILICVATIILITDNLMLKNSANLLEDYSSINALKNKIEEYTLMEDRDIEQITLWGKYLSYAVSFGIASKIVKRVKGLHLDDDLEELLGDKIMRDFIISDYYLFYQYASLDRRFASKYANTAINVLSRSGSSGGSGGGFSGGGGYSGGGGRGRRRRSLLNQYNIRKKLKVNSSCFTAF